jgi:uncharacterized protein (TIGR03435 family)
VDDATGLTGLYDVSFGFSTGTLRVGESTDSEPMTPAAAALPSAGVFAAIQDQLGLRLDKKRRVIDFFVLDRFEKTPTEN